jgi:hypothetical protein
MQQMTPEEYRAFLLERPRTAKLATVRADGRPHVAPIWFDLDGDARSSPPGTPPSRPLTYAATHASACASTTTRRRLPL